MKTYGAGRDVNTYNWNHYFGQLINLGYVYVAHEDFNKLKLTNAARRVLFEGEKVELVRFETVKARRDSAVKAKVKIDKSGNPRLRDGLFEHLRALRKELAKAKGVPPYSVFSDKTLEEMAAMKPIDADTFTKVSGVGEFKLRAYGDRFIDAICEYEKIERTSPKISDGNERAKPKKKEPTTISDTMMDSVRLFKSGMDVNEIAGQRQLSPATIVGHLSKAYQRGEDLDMTRLVDKSIIDQVAEVLNGMEDKSSVTLSQLMPHFEENTISYNELRFAKLHLERNAA